MSYWTAAYTKPSTERKVQKGIEELGFGTFLPTFARGWYDIRARRIKAREYPLCTRYIFVCLDENSKWGRINNVDGIDRVMTSSRLGFEEKNPIRISEREVARMMLSHAMGEHNQIQARSANGAFSGKRKQKKRRRRPRSGKVYTNCGVYKGNQTHVMAHA